MSVLAAVAATTGHAQGSGIYTVRGIADDPKAEGKTIYIKPIDSSYPLDSTIVTNGRFFFTGQVDTAELCRIDIGYNVYANFILENGNITVDMKNHNSPSGTPLNNMMKTLEAEPKLKTYTDEDLERMRKRSDGLFAKHSNDALGYYMLMFSDYFRMRSEADQERIVDGLGPWLRSKTVVQNVILPRIMARKTSAEGQMFTDIMGLDLDGQPKMLSEYVGHGNYVLMDMWAGWCRPCRAEIPYLALLNEKYGGKGLTVVGLFVWDDYENLPKAMNADGVTWPQIFDVNNTAAKAYGVSGIPHIILFGPDGRIIARNLRGEKMIETVERIMKMKNFGK